MNRGPIIPAIALWLTACGGGGGDDGGGGNVNVPPPNPPPPPVQTGVFKDLNVTGLAFESGGESGTTDENGRYTCETGNSVTFSLGGIELGSTDCATLVMPQQLADDSQMSYVLEITNMARFLQMLDEDVDPDNGILISEPVRQMAESWTQVDFLTADIATALVTIISEAASVDPSPGTVHALPDENDAFVHLHETYACAYAGAYAGSITGGDSGPAGLLVGLQLIGNSFIPFVWDAIAFDGAEGFVVSIAGGPGSDFTIRNRLTAVQGQFDIVFTTPDDIDGTWDGNTLELRRIGADDGSAYRFVGFAQGAETDTIVSLNFDGTDFAGEAFEQSDGTLFDVTGTLTGDTVTLTATGGGESFEATGDLETHPDGSPSHVVGTVDNGADFGLAACRLN